MYKTLVPLFACALLSACTPTLEDGFANDLIVTGGCGDVVLFAANEDDSVMLYLRVEGLVEESEEGGTETTTARILPDEAVTLVVEVGTKVSAMTCDDVMERGTKVNDTYTPVSGTATITIHPTEDESEPTADLHLESVIFENERGERAEVTSFDLAGIAVGWLAG